MFLERLGLKIKQARKYVLRHNWFVFIASIKIGAGRAITGRWEIREWYSKNKDIMKLHEQTRVIVENILYRG